MGWDCERAPGGRGEEGAGVSDFDFFAPPGLTAALGLTREGGRMDTEVKWALLGLIGDTRKLVAKVGVAVGTVSDLAVRNLTDEYGAPRMNRIEGYVREALKGVKRGE